MTKQYDLASAATPGISLISGCTNHCFAYPDPEVSIQNLRNTVSYLSSISPPRSYDNPESLRECARYISQRFSEYGFRVVEQDFDVGGATYVNVVASVGPAGHRLIVGAHYDVHGNLPGADDNASAIAGLLEIAHFAKKHETELPYGIDFVAYSLEESPFFGTTQMGSFVHAESMHRKKVKIRGMICLEMIGFFTDNEKSQAYPLPLFRLFYPSVGDFIGVVSNYGSSSLARQIAKHMRVADMDVRTLCAPSFVWGVDLSDHRNYWAFGYDAVMITDTSFYRNPNYHNETDIIGTLSFESMQEVVKGVCWAVLNIK
jgi:hypothetical protein